MPEIVLRASAVLLACVFGWSAIAKLIRWKIWRAVLVRYRLGRTTPLVAGAVVVVELAVPGVLLFGASKLGAALALFLVVAFSLVVVRARGIQGDRLPCGCFGKADTRDYRTVLVRNAVLGLLSAVILLGRSDAAVTDGFRWPAGAELVPAALVVTGAVTAALIGVGVTRALRKGQL